MSLTTGSRLGSYEILGLLGVGGMGEVYRAHDTKLNRDVAIKILPEAFARDPDRIARFQREAQLLAALNHPNIAAIYGLEEAKPSTTSTSAGRGRQAQVRRPSIFWYSSSSKGRRLPNDSTPRRPITPST